jgi:hypothetical protein
MDESEKDKWTRRLEAVKGYLLAAFPDDELHVKAHDGDLSWQIQVIRAHQLVHEKWIRRRFLDDDGSNPGVVTALTVWGLAAKMKMNGTRPTRVTGSRPERRRFEEIVCPAPRLTG